MLLKVINFRNVLRALCPHALVVLSDTYFKVRKTELEKKRLISGLRGAGRGSISDNWSLVDRDAVIEFLSGRGLDSEQMNMGSIPSGDLDAILEFLKGMYRDVPLLGIHVGNFIGASLVTIAARLKQMNTRNHLLSLDPNLPHRGINGTENWVTEVLRAFNLTDMVTRLWGYSLARSDAREQVVEPSGSGAIPENQLRLLTKFLSGNIDFILLDGCHVSDYLESEISTAYELLRPGGAIFVDDISPVSWKNLYDVFTSRIDESKFSRKFIGRRTGVLVKTDS